VVTGASQLFRARALILLLIVVALQPAAVLAIERGQGLVEALDELRRSGLTVIYSSALVDPTMTVVAAPEPGSAAAIAAQILAPYALSLEPVRAGVFVVVRRRLEVDSNTGSLEVIVASVDGASQPARSVSLFRDLGSAADRTRIAARLTDAAGIAAFSDIPAGRYDVVLATPAGPLTLLRAVAIGAGETVRVPAYVAADLVPLDEVTVFASRYRVNALTDYALMQITRKNLEALPGLDQDVLRVMRYLPGTASNGVSARPNVRGGRDNELETSFDGVPLFEPFHFKDFQGLLGVFDPGVISTLDLYSGVAPVRHGDRLSGVLNLQPRLPSEGNYHELGASLLYAHGLSVGRTELRGAEGSWLASLRVSTAELVLKSLSTPEVDPVFADALLRAETRLPGGLSLRGGLMFLNDRLEADIDQGRERSSAAYRDRTLWIGVDTPARNGLQFSGLLSATDRRTRRLGSVFDSGSVAGSLRDLRDFDATTVRIEAQSDDSRGPAWRLGYERRDYDAEFDYTADVLFAPELAALFGRSASLQRQVNLESAGLAQAAYGSVLVQPGARWRASLGMRFDDRRYVAGASVLSQSEWSPRLAVEYERDDRTTLRASVGRVTQAERPDELQVSDGEQFFSAVQSARQIVLSVDRALSADLSLRVEAYRKDVSSPAPRYENLLNPIAVLPELEVDRIRVAPISARLYGTEFSARWQPRERWAGWLNYTWSEAIDRFTAAETPRSWDQQHSVTAGLSWTRRPWQLSGTTTYHPGWRRTGFDDAGDNVLALLPRNGGEWPPFFSLDLRATWIRALPVGSLKVYGELINATDRANACCSRISLLREGESFSLSQERSNWLPRYVMLGATWQFD